jgi:hypothetical protein
MAWQDIARGIVGGFAGAAGDTYTQAKMDTMNQQAGQNRANQKQLQMAPMIQEINADKVRASSLLDSMGNVLPGKQNEYDDLRTKMALNFGKVRNAMGDKEPADSPGHMSRAMAFIEDHLKKAATGKMGQKEGELGEKQNEKVSNWGRTNQTAAQQLSAGTVPFELTDEYKKLKMQEQAAEDRIRSNFMNFKNPDGTVVSVDVNHQTPPPGAVKIGTEPAIPKPVTVTGPDGKPIMGSWQPDGTFKDQSGKIVPSVTPYNKPSTSPVNRYADLVAKSSLAKSGKGPQLTDQERAEEQGLYQAMTMPEIIKAKTWARAQAENNTTEVTIDGHTEVIPRSAAIARYVNTGRGFGGKEQGSATGLDKRNQMLARSAISQIDTMENILKSDPGLTGPGAGQWTQFMNWVGSGSPDAQVFLASSTFLSEHGVGVFGGRNIHSINDLKDTLGSFRTNPQALMAALEAGRNTMQPWTNAGGRLPVSGGSSAGNSGGRSSGSQSKRGHYVGEKVKLKNGQTVTVKKVYSDGSFE